MNTASAAPSTTAETVLSLNHPADVLAMVRHTFGCLPRRSLVVIGLHPDATGGHLRIDIPEESADVVAWARRTAECIAGGQTAPTPGAAIVVLFDDQAAQPGWEGHPESRPCAELVEALCLVFEVEYDVEVPQVWYVGDGHMRDYDCLEAGCCPYPGQGQDELLDQATTRHPGLLFDQPRSSDPAEAVRHFEAQGNLDAEFVQRVTRLSAALLHACSDEEPPYQCLTAWDSALQTTCETGSTLWLAESGEQAAAMVAALSWKSSRDMLIPLAAVGFETAVYGHLAHHTADGGTQFLGGVAELAETLGRQAGQDVDQLADDYARCYLGDTGRRPDWARLDALADLLGMLAGCAEGDAWPNILSLMAWVEWARGRGSRAGAFLDRCRQDHPDHELALLIEQFMGLVGICPWARTKPHSWSWWHNRGM